MSAEICFNNFMMKEKKKIEEVEEKSEEEIEVQTEEDALELEKTLTELRAVQDRKALKQQRKYDRVMATLAMIVLVSALPALAWWSQKQPEVQEKVQRAVETQLETDRADHYSTAITTDPEQTWNGELDEDYGDDEWTRGIKELWNMKDEEFGNIQVIEKKGMVYDQAQRQAIRDYGFVVRGVRGAYALDPEQTVERQDDWTNYYSSIAGGGPCSRNPANAVLVTSDVVLHVYHKMFDQELEYLEDTQFLPELRTLLQQMMTQTKAKLAQAQGKERESLQRLADYLAIPLALVQSVDTSVAPGYTRAQVGYLEKLDFNKVKSNLETVSANFSSEDQKVVRAEMEKVLAADKVMDSELTGEPFHDYTQYTTRGHYNANSLGQAYFKAMMWLGRANFKFNTNNKESDLQAAYDALNLVKILADAGQLERWRGLKEPIDYLVGNADDLSVDDVKSLATDVTWEQMPQKLAQLQALETPKVMSAVVRVDADTTKSEAQAQTQAFSLFSQRFTPDAYILSSLTQGEETVDLETGERLPSTATALMAAAALGNDLAESEYNVWLKENWPDSVKISQKTMAALQQEMAAWKKSDWQANNYTSWLYTLASLNDAQPTAKTNAQAWQAKNLNAWLGSYTELKHDTVLYAKQAYAEKGGGGDCEEMPMVYGYVEDNPEFFLRMKDLLAANISWLKKNQNLDDESDPVLWRLQRLAESASLYEKVALAQAVNTKLDDEVYEELRNDTRNLDWALSPIFTDETQEKDARSALVADIFTDGVTGKVVYEANGYPDLITVLVDDVNGKRLVRGLVYNYREFTKPLEARLTDQDWWQDVYVPEGTERQLPAQPAWWTPYFGAK